MENGDLLYTDIICMDYAKLLSNIKIRTAFRENNMIKNLFYMTSATDEYKNTGICNLNASIVLTYTEGKLDNHHLLKHREHLHNTKRGKMQDMHLKF
jgi:hypothetical protein